MILYMMLCTTLYILGGDVGRGFPPPFGTTTNNIKAINQRTTHRT